MAYTPGLSSVRIHGKLRVGGYRCQPQLHWPHRASPLKRLSGQTIWSFGSCAPAITSPRCVAEEVVSMSNFRRWLWPHHSPLPWPSSCATPVTGSTVWRIWQRRRSALTQPTIAFGTRSRASPATSGRSSAAAASADPAVGMIRINGVMTPNFRRLQPLLVGVIERQALSVTAQAQAALPPQDPSVRAYECCAAVLDPIEFRPRPRDFAPLRTNVARCRTDRSLPPHPLGPPGLERDAGGNGA